MHTILVFAAVGARACLRVCACVLFPFPISSPYIHLTDSWICMKGLSMRAAHVTGTLPNYERHFALTAL